MAQADDRAEWRVRPWAGTIDQLKRAARRCEAKVAAAVPYPEGYDPEAPEQRFDAAKHEEWRAAKDAREVVIKILEENGFSRRLTSIEDLDDLGLDQLGRIEGIDVDVGGGGYASPSAGITASTDRGLTVSLAGPDRSWTAGLRHELEVALKPAGKLRPLPFRAEAYFVLAAVVFNFLALGLSVYFDSQTDWSDAAVVGVSLGIGAVVAAAVVTMGVRLPTLELLSSGGKPAYERWRGRIAATAGALIFGIVGSLTAARIGG